MSIVKTVFSVSSPVVLIAEEAFPFDGDEPDGESIDYKLAGYPEPDVVTNEYVCFRNSVRENERKVSWEGAWTITGMGDAQADCGNHLGLYSDGTNYTRTRSSCHTQRCPICSWKWQSRAGDNASRYLQYLVRECKVPVRHVSFNPAAFCTLSGDKVKAAVDGNGHVIPSAQPGDFAAFKLEVLRAFLETFHNNKTGPLGFAYILHPGREETRGSGDYYYSPHVHLFTNFSFDKSRKAEMKRWCLDYGFTLTVFRNKRTKRFNMYPFDYKCEDPKSEFFGRVVNDLTAKLIYNFSHALLVKDSRTRRAIVYCGAWRPSLHDYVKVKRRILVRSKEGRCMYKCKHEVEENGGEVRCVPVKKYGNPVPELTRSGKLKWLRILRIDYVAPKSVQESDSVVARSRKSTSGWWVRHSLPIDQNRLRSVLGKTFLENLLSYLDYVEPEIVIPSGEGKYPIQLEEDWYGKFTSIQNLW